MEPAPARPRDEAIDHDDLLVHEWRVTQLTRLEIPCRWPQAAAEGLAEGTTNIRIYGTPSQAILEMPGGPHT
jgi:hypothetical protein